MTVIDNWYSIFFLLQTSTIIILFLLYLLCFWMDCLPFLIDPRLLNSSTHRRLTDGTVMSNFIKKWIIVVFSFDLSVTYSFEICFLYRSKRYSSIQRKIDAFFVLFYGQTFLTFKVKFCGKLFIFLFYIAWKMLQWKI